MKIALLGGAFNPPHLGHLMIAQQILDFTDTEEVWFLPNYGQQPPKPDVASVEDRLAMTKFLILPKTQVSTLEIDNNVNGDTINLIPFLPKEHNYTFILGSDWLPSFTTWPKWEDLLATMPFLIFPRAGFPIEPLQKNMTVVQNENLIITDISATKIRNRIKAGLPIDQFVPREVASYIKDRGLYR